MVATRRGVRVSSPSKSDTDHSSVTQATPSTGRRTRRTAKAPESPTQTTVEEASSQLKKIAESNPPPASARIRCNRASRLHSPDKPCTPLGSVHEGDLSDVESCSSAVSEIKAPLTRRSTRRRPCAVNQEDDVSEVESCSSAVSASRPGVRRSTRKKQIPAALDSGDVKKDKMAPETAPPSVSQCRRRTRNQIIDSELSDVESVSEDASKSTVRRSTRSRRQLHAIPKYLEESSESSLSPAPTASRIRVTRGRAAPAKIVSEPQSCDSEGFESGPTYSKSKLTESDSDCIPSSSRAGSGIAVLTKDVSIVLEKATVQPDKDASLNDSKFQSSIIAEAAENTLLEEEGNKEECSNITPTETKQELESTLEKPTTEEIEEISPDPIPVFDKVTADEPAAMAEDQQEEPSAESLVDNNSEMEMMQETVQAPEPSQPLQSASVTTCEPEITEKGDEVMEVEDASVLDDMKLFIDEEDDDDVAMPEEDKMEDSSVSAEVQQVVDSIQEPSSQTKQDGEEPIEATTSQEQPPEGAVVQSKNVITLLDSSEEEDDEDDKYADDEDDSSGDEEEGDLETTGEDWRPKESGIKSVDGLFMIDTRPGQEANEDYYKNEAREEAADEEEDEVFVDEEVEDDEDDEGADILFSSRNSHLQELSSRIDPGIKMKELGGLYISFDGSKSKPVSSSQKRLKEKKIQDEVMKKSVIGPDFEKKEAVPLYKESKHTLKLKRRSAALRLSTAKATLKDRSNAEDKVLSTDKVYLIHNLVQAEREKTTGDAWFNMKAPEITQELKGDLQLLRMRGSMDSKRFYKKNDRDGFPKYFQMGTVVDNPVDFYHSRIPKKERKRTMVEELLTDAEFRHKNKKKFQSIMAEKAAQGSGRRRKMKNKFHKK